MKPKRSASAARGQRGTFEAVEAVGRTLPDVEVTTAWGQPALKTRGKMFACMASHKSAEANSLVVRVDFAGRDALLEDDPGTYYLPEHYVAHPCVLVRLSRIRADALRDLVCGAHRFVSARTRRKSAGSTRNR
ncbi:MAG TPA: MmcQ/YjbR family DNA-binding protein [Vicinamibacterales bacterium]|nr:MmcQ/YjbR family DNA-binding protein [Vicinamibacterales bacterium]